MIESFRELSRVPETNPSALRSLEREIMNVDTDVFLATRLPEIAAAIIYLYYRLSWNSVSIAEELGLKSPHIRQILYRLNKAYENMQRLELGKEREYEDRAANLVQRTPQSCSLLNREPERDGFRPNQS
jgi:DNA-directed RNA polymerase specialized sigma24 family protein